LYYKTDFYDHFTFESVIGQNCRIHPTAFIDKGVIIGDYVTVGAKSVINRGSRIGYNTTIGCGSIIGSEGFQVLRFNGIPTNIKHAGETHIGTNVYIGDNTTVCTSLFEGATVVGENTKIDNLVYIAHNCSVGKNIVITAGTMLCGSSMLKDFSWIGVNSSVLNRITIGENALIGSGSVVTRDVPDNRLVYGVPAKEMGFPR
jgi:UDP-3-O-[3-hydroxymyristoyl] glucosamine N-acyltransferase